jgi:hypothetical protein
MRLVGVICAALLLAADFASAQSVPKPLIHAHAHNDYLHKYPLYDALDQGFCSVEADIFLVEGKLLVAHNRGDLKPERTLQALYLDPLRERVKQNGGRVFRNGPEFTLLIDLKTDWTNTYPVLRSVLTNYADVFTSFRGDVKKTNAVTAIITGSRALEMFSGETVRYAAFDGTPAQLEVDASPNLIPWISADWKSLFLWNGEGSISDVERQKLVKYVKTAHAHGRRVRFWGGPDTAAARRLLLDADVDLINTDDLSGLAKFLRERQKS